MHQRYLRYFAALIGVAILSVILFISLSLQNTDVPQNILTSAIPSQSQLAQLSGAGSGLVAYWNFDEGSGTTAADSSGSGINATLSGGASWTTGKIGGAISLDGSTGYVDIPNNNALHISSGTFAAWVKTTTDTDINLFSAAQGASTSHFSIELGNGVTSFCTSELIAVLINQRMCYTTAGRTELFDGNWHHIVITTDTSTHIYLDGAAKTVTVAGGTDNGSFTSSSLYDTFRLGNLKLSGANVNQFNGQIDDVRIYNRALSAAEVTSLYAAVGSPPPPPAAPVISAVSATSITTVGATINWTTDKTSTSQVYYGLTTAYGSQTAKDSSLITSHGQSLSGLQTSTVYHYKVESTDSTPNTTISGDNTFTTASVPVVQFVITATAGPGGTISPLGAVSVNQAASQTFTVTPNAGYTVNQLLVDGVAATLTNNQYIFSNVQLVHTIAVTFNAPVLDTTAPSVPGAPSLNGSVTYNSVPISWTVSTDNVAVAGYKIFRNGTQISTSLVNSYTDNAVSPSTSYTYTVSAYDTAATPNNSAISASSPTITTPAAPVLRSYLWSGIIAPARATDWSIAGVTGGIPNRTTQCGATVAAYSGTAATINTAIQNCGAGQYVQLGAGTFSLSSGISFTKSNVTLRGMGSDQTRLIFSGSVSPCHYFVNAAIAMCTGATNYGATNQYDHSANWTAGYSQGTSVITLSDATGLAAGSTLFLDQANDGSDGYPATGDLYICETNTNNCSSQGGGGQAGRPGRSETMIVKVTAVSGTNVTISPPVYLPNYRSGQAPGAWWPNQGAMLSGSGVENLLIDITTVGSTISGVEMVNAENVWVKGTRIITQYNSTTGNDIYQMLLINVAQATLTGNYLYGPNAIGNQRYAISGIMSAGILIENNIFHHTTSAFVPNGPLSRSVIAYNEVNGATMSLGGTVMHGLTIGNLYEGNAMAGILGDIIHAPHFLETLFRNNFDGATNNPGTNVTTPLTLETNARFWNIIGNVIGENSSASYEADLSAGCSSCVYRLGWRGNASGQVMPDDSNVARTLFRWGNWDKVTNGTRFNASEVPSGINNYLNAIPSSQFLPASFYLSSVPSWWTTPWGTPNWPAIGPDVSGGNVTTSPTGGHAYKIPSRLCYENTPVDPSYSASSPRILLFNATNCYGNGVIVPPALTVPSISTQPTGQSVQSGSTATFSVAASGNPSPTYQWQKMPSGGSFANISGATTANYTTPGTVAGDNSSSYKVIVTNSQGSVTSSSATLTVSAASLNTYYVSPTGSDSNTGSASAPFLTIQKAASVVNPGDTVSVADGTYTSSGQIVVDITRGGTAASPVIFKSQNKWGAIIDGRSNGSLEAFALETGVSNVKIQNFEMRNFSQAGVTGNTTNINSVTISGNLIHDIGRMCTDTTNGLVGIYVHSASANVIDGNVIHDIGRYASGENGCAPTTAFYQNHDHGIYVDGVTNVTISNNIFYNNNRGWDIQVYSGNNTQSTGLNIINNTFASKNPYRNGNVLLTTPGESSSVVQNNIFYNPSLAGVNINNTATFSGVTVSNNMTFGGVVNTAIATGVSLTGNIDNTDPKLVNPSLNDFHLQAASPAINTGTTLSQITTDMDGNARPFGSAYDIGAYEYSQTVINPGTVTLSVTNNGGGTITSSPAGINCGVTCSLSVTSGTIVTLTAVPNTGYTTAWTGCTSAVGNTCTISPSANVTVNASFADTQAPTVSITAPTSGSSVSGSVNLQAAVSDNGTISTVQFKLDGANIGSALTTAPYSGSWNTAGVANGSHTITAVALDVAGNTATSLGSVVTVNNVSLPPVVTLTSVPASTPAPATSITFTATASSPNTGGSISKVEFYNGTTLVGTSLSAPYTYTITNQPQGNYAITAKAYDNAGQTTSSSFTAAVTNTPPVLPAIGSKSVNENSLLTFAIGPATDANGDTLTYSATGLPSGATFTASTRTFRWPPTFDQSGSYTATFTVDDGHGGSVSQTITITVVNVDRAPTSSAGNDLTVNLPTNSVTLQGSGTDLDLQTLTYAWSQLNGPSTPTFTTNIASPVVSNLVAGTYGFRLTVSDGTYSSTDDMLVTVNPVVVVITDTDGDRVSDTVDKCSGTANSQISLLSVVNLLGCPLPKTNNFTITSLANVDLNSVSAFSLSNSFGSISFASANGPYRLVPTGWGSQLDIDSNVLISQGSVFLNSAALTQLNVPATIVLNNITNASPVILRDGALCASCAPSKSGNTLTFTAPGFSTYTVGNAADTIAPIVSVTSPTNGATYSYGSAISLSAAASDNSAVSGVYFLANGSIITSSVVSAPYTVSWQPSPGTYSIQAIAYDSSLNYATSSASVTIVISSPINNTNSPDQQNIAGNPQGVLTPTVPQLPASTTPAVADASLGTSGLVAPGTPITRALSLGSVGTDVIRLKWLLQQSGYTISDPSNPTFDVSTDGALKAYQCKEGIVCSGTVLTTGYGVTGPKTRTALGALTARLTYSTASNCPVGLVCSLLPSNTTLPAFTRSLKVTSTGTDVKNLQIFLNAKGYKVSAAGNGSPGHETTYFGQATKSALIRFQNANAAKILAPLGLTQGTGYFGPSSIKLVNSLLK